MLDDAKLTLIADRQSCVLTTLKRDGTPQLSIVSYTFDPDTGVLRASITDGRAKTRNLHRDPRASALVTPENMFGYVVLEGNAELSPVAADPHDATVEELIEVYRAINGEHPDWDEYRQAMVDDKRLVLRLHVSHSYGWAAQ